MKIPSHYTGVDYFTSQEQLFKILNKLYNQEHCIIDYPNKSVHYNPNNLKVHLYHTPIGMWKPFLS